MNAIIKVPTPFNEPVYSYAQGSREKKDLKAQLDKMLNEKIEIPLVIGGKEILPGNMADCRCPHDHNHLLAQYHTAGPPELDKAVKEAQKAWKDWSVMDWKSRASIFLRAGELLATKYRYILNAATMLGQSKTVHQAEIDAACELIDFYRFNPYFMRQIYTQQPDSSHETWNYMEYRALEGFVFAVTPFNFTSIAGNLPTSPAMMGNTFYNPVVEGGWVARWSDKLRSRPRTLCRRSCLRKTWISWSSFHWKHFCFSRNVEDHRVQHHELQNLSQNCGGDRRKGLCLCPCIC
jgi:1-pyrroline-5-carboxylate dehydrogenase